VIIVCTVIPIYQTWFLRKCDTLIAFKNKRLPTLVLSHIFRNFFYGPWQFLHINYTYSVTYFTLHVTPSINPEISGFPLSVCINAKSSAHYNGNRNTFMEDMLLIECQTPHNIVLCFVVLRMLKHNVEDCAVGN